MTLNGTDVDLATVRCQIGAMVLGVPPSYGTLSLFSSGSPVLGVGLKWTLGAGLWYLPSFTDPTAYLWCGPRSA